MPSTSILMKSTGPETSSSRGMTGDLASRRRQRSAWRRARPAVGRGWRAAAIVCADRACRGRRDRRLSSRFSATTARIAAAARGSGSIGITRSACITLAKNSVWFPVLAPTSTMFMPARQPLCEERQLLLLEEEAAHLLALDHRVEPGIGQPQRSIRRSGAGMKTGSRFEAGDQARAVRLAQAAGAACGNGSDTARSCRHLPRSQRSSM